MLAARARRDPRSFVAWMLLLEAGCLGSFVSLDLIMFFLFFELTLVPVYFVIAGWGYARRGYAAIKFFVYTFLGSAFLLVGIVAVAFIHQRQTGHLTFDLVALSTPTCRAPRRCCCSWPSPPPSPSRRRSSPSTPGRPTPTPRPRPAAPSSWPRSWPRWAPTASSASTSTCSPGPWTLAPLLLTLGVIGILYGAVVACAQRDLKRLVAYSSLAHIGFIVLGTFALTTQGLTGGVLQMVNHGLIIAVLFIVIGWIYERRTDLAGLELRGLQRRPR